MKYKIKLFRYITILFGNIEIIDVGVAIHVNNIKAFILYYKDIFSMRKKFKPLKDYHLYRLNSIINIGYSKNYDLVSSFSIMYNSIANCCGFVVNMIKPYLKIKNDINIYEDKDIFSIKVNFIILFNLLMILLSLVKILLEKFNYAIKKQSN